MKRAWYVTALALAVCGGWLGLPQGALAQQRTQWVWHADPEPGTRYFRRVFDINRPVQVPVDEATLDIAATGPFTVWVNGAEVGKGDDRKRVFAYDVKKHLVHGKNAVAVEVRHEKGPAGLLLRLGYVPNGQSKLAMVSDGAWRSVPAADEGWRRVDFVERGWTPVRVLGPYGKAGPLRDLVWDSGGDDRFSVPPGFRVQQAVRHPDGDKTFSLVNMTFDARGRLLVSREGGPILLCTDPDAEGQLKNVRPYCTQVTNCQGMCWVHDALLLVGNGPKGTGLYRVRDLDGDDRTDEAVLLHAFKGGMGEHGPHAIIHGPDGWLYLVIGNHAWAKVNQLASNSPLTRWPTGGMGPDQGKPGTTEDVLLPRLNDSRGHAANILAPGGTVWRLDHEGNNLALVAAGFRNHYDAAFNPAGELFTFDSDMEWDEALPWYRAVRVCQCSPGADFVWRTGAANTPDYYLDSLPPLAETGRGSPVGVEFYDHVAYPEKYRGAFFMADWAIGVIFAVHLERDGATYKGKVERFCSGAPMNVTDCVVGPDGALWFTTGGRGTMGGVYRVAYDPLVTYRTLDGRKPDVTIEAGLKKQLGKGVLYFPQPLSAWSRARQVGDGGTLTRVLEQALNPELPMVVRQNSFNVFLQHAGTHQWARPRPEAVTRLLKDDNAEVRAQGGALLGLMEVPNRKEVLLEALRDKDGMVRRRACDSLIRAGIEPPVEAIWPLLSERDRFLRHAARLVLERIDPQRWEEKLRKEKDSDVVWQGIIALCRTNKAAPYADYIFDALRSPPAGKNEEALGYLRTLQMALIHVPDRPASVKGIAGECFKLFPQADWRVNRELAIVLVALQREGQLTQSVQGELLQAMEQSKGDRMQQIHYAYCMRLLRTGWTTEQRVALARWYSGTRDWKGGHSFTPFIENIFREALGAYTTEDRKAILAKAGEAPLAAQAVLQQQQLDRDPDLMDSLKGLADAPPAVKGVDLKKLALDALLKTATAHPTPSSFPYLVAGLSSANPLIRSDSVRALHKLGDAAPKKDDAGPYRALLEATQNLPGPKDRWLAVEVLRRWNGRSFGAPTGKADQELKLWARWFNQAFPKEKALAFAAGTQAAESKYKLGELVKLLEVVETKTKGDPARGKLVYAKANCVKCHKHGKEGEGIGPDLSSLSKRFKRVDVLEAILDPSKVISDQYRSMTIITTGGQQLTGLAAVQGDTVNVVLNDATKVTLKRDEIDTQVASLVSVMPDRLLDALTPQEIADLLAYLDSDPQP